MFGGYFIKDEYYEWRLFCSYFFAPTHANSYETSQGNSANNLS